MPNPAYTLTWALDEPMSHNADATSSAPSAPTEPQPSSRSLSPLDITCLETAFKALLDAQEERLKHSIHKRIQALMDKVQESHSKVIEAAEAVLKDRKKDRAEQARMSMASSQLIPAPVSGPSKQEWDVLMDDIQRIHERLNDLTEHFAGVADEPLDGDLAGVPEFSPRKQEFANNANVDAYAYADAGVDVDVDADVDVDVDAWEEFKYPGDGMFKRHALLLFISCRK
jgi:hypothetical protein